MAGLSYYGEDAFQPPYAKLGSLRVLLSKGTPFQALSATLPDHILATVKHHLSIAPNSLELRLTTNCPNITYTTLPIVGSLQNFENLCFLIPSTFHPPMVIPKTLIFHDSKQDAMNAADFIESNLPQCLRNSGLVNHPFQHVSQVDPMYGCRYNHWYPGDIPMQLPSCYMRAASYFPPMQVVSVCVHISLFTSNLGTWL